MSAATRPADAGVYAVETKACVTQLYTDAGYEPVPTSPTETADLAAAQQSVVDAQATADSALLTLESAQKGPAQSETLAASTTLQAAQRAFNDAVASGMLP